MRFRRQQNPPLTVNLVPMMDVLMTVLTFFIIISMTLTGQRIENVDLPTLTAGAASQDDPQRLDNALIIGLNSQNEIIHDGRPVSKTELVQVMQNYQRQTPDGLIILKADRGLPYDDILTLLNVMKEVGGYQVSLAVEQGG